MTQPKDSLDGPDHYGHWPKILHDEDSGLYFVAESSGPRSWRYHRFWWRALLELWLKR